MKNVANYFSQLHNFIRLARKKLQRRDKGKKKKEKCEENVANESKNLTARFLTWRQTRTATDRPLLSTLSLATWFFVLLYHSSCLLSLFPLTPSYSLSLSNLRACSCIHARIYLRHNTDTRVLPLPAHCR